MRWSMGGGGSCAAEMGDVVVLGRGEWRCNNVVVLCFRTVTGGGNVVVSVGCFFSFFIFRNLLAALDL